MLGHLQGTAHSCGGLFYPAITFFFFTFYRFLPPPGARTPQEGNSGVETGVQPRSLPCFGAEQDSCRRRSTGAWLERVVAPVLLKEGYVRTCAYPLHLEHAGFNATWAGRQAHPRRSLALINGRAGQAANHRHPTQPLYNFRCSAAGSERIASDHFQILTKIKKGRASNSRREPSSVHFHSIGLKTENH